MLIYVESKLFQHKTFTLVCNPYDTVARARAYLLHILYELGKSQHQFRLRFKGEYLRDCHTFDDYGILDNSVIKMVPMARTNENLLKLGSKRSLNIDEDILTPGPKPNLLLNGHLHEIQEAVYEEVKIFKRREYLLGLFKALLWVHFLAAFMAFSSYYWYSGFWSGVLMLFGLYYSPTYSKMAGFVGRNNIRSNHHYLTFFGIGAALHFTGSLLMGIYLALEVQSYACGEMESSCNRQKEVLTWSVVFYLGHAAFLLASFILVLLLFRNFQYEVGDIIVDNLVQSRDLDKVLRSAKLGGIKERRNAAFEMVSLVASNSETKMAVVNEGGLQVLINLALSTDSATQEYATEAISEMLTHPSIQVVSAYSFTDSNPLIWTDLTKNDRSSNTDSWVSHMYKETEAKFVEAGGIRTLCALLRSSDMRVVTEAVTAMSYIVADNEANRSSFIAENGLNDLSHVSTKVSAPLSRIVAGMFLELAFSSEIRSIMSTLNAPVHALLSLSKVDDHETLRLSLQTLELLAIENPTVILANSNLLVQLLSVPKFEEDEQLYLLAGKIILYYASDENGCSKLVESGKLKETLLQFSHTANVALQAVIAKIVLAVVDSYENKDTILEMSLDEVLLNIHDTADHTAWELVDQALTILKDIAPYSKKSESAGSTIQSDGSGPSTSQQSEKEKTGTVKRK